MLSKRMLHLIIGLTITVGSTALLAAAAALTPPHSHTPSAPLADNPNPPVPPVKLIFIHHSTGENWLADDHGRLGLTLRDNNYFVSDTNYGWGPDSIGDHTDIGYWWTWFAGPHRHTYTAALYTEYDQHSSYSRLATDPGGENEIIMFKSCFPNSHLGGNPTDPPTTGDNPLRGQDAWSEHHTVANAKGIYNDILAYFATRQDKLFVVITAPPLVEGDSDAEHAANARAFNNWLVSDWLDGYPYNNVAVFDFYNVLTSNGGDVHTNDLGWETGNHHRWWNGAVQHIQTVSNNFAAYGSAPRDSHPTAAGGQKASGEFVPLLNVFYNRWKSGAVLPSLTLTAPNGGENWPVNSQQQIRWTSAGTITHVSLSYSTDDFTTPHVISSPVANTGLYTWTTPLTPTTSARVRVASVVSPTTVYDDSDADFTLYDPTTFTNTVCLPVVLRNYAPSTPTDGTLIQPTDLVYLGAFRLPDVPGPDEYSWKWSNWASAMAYYPDGDPAGPDDGYPGSIFGVGHDQTQYVSEINIPIPIISPGKNVNDLNTAETLQGFRDIRGGLFDYMEMPRVGLAYLLPQGEQTSGKLYFAWAPHLDEGATNPSHGWCELNLSNPQTAGAWRIGDYWNYITGDYLFPIPQEWADTYTRGMYLATGRFRDGGQGAEGPSLFAIGPWNEGNPPASGATLPATPLLLYSAVTDDEQHTLNSYHHSDEWNGGAWLTAGDKSAVIFVGTKGTGECWYGDPEGPCLDCEDRGWWSTGFVGQILFYDPADLAAVVQGEMETWEPQPYATLDIDEYLYHIESTQQKYHLGAASFDRDRGLLYVFEPLADGDKPLVHVWRIVGTGG